MPDLSKYKDIFVSEAEDHIESMNRNLLTLEKDQKNKNILNELMRSSHTVKSSSSTMGYEKMAYLTHVMEDVFDHARSDLLPITNKIIDKLFEVVDKLAQSLTLIKDEGKEEDVSGLIDDLKELTGVSTSGSGKSQRDEHGKPINKSKNNTEQDQSQDQDPILKKENTETAKKEKINSISHIKVPVERLDNLMDLLEELLIDKMKLEQAKEKSEDKDFISTINHFSRVVSDIQYQVMQVHLVPVGQIFARFPRMIRDLAKTHEKEIVFETEGDEIELDRTIVDKLGEPLVHLLKNAVDHGVKEKGKIKLKAKREKDFVTIYVENDGNYIDLEKVKSSAIKKGIISAQRAEVIDEKSLKKLIYHPSLSTKESVTETSGRGIGMSVVKEFVEQIGGRVSFETLNKQGGTRFSLELPLTIAIVKALLVKVDDGVFAIPFSNIERSVTVPFGNIRSMADQDVAIVDETDIPLVRLNKIFSYNKSKETKSEIMPSINENKKKKDELIVIVRRGKDTAGIVVDLLFGKQEIIVKPLPGILKGTQGFSGSTILGDGSSVLILDIVSLLEDSSKLVRYYE